MGNALSIEPAVTRASQELDGKIKAVNLMASQLMDLASGHGDQKLKAIEVVLNDFVKLVSQELEEKMKLANILASETMLLGTSEMDKRIQFANSVLDYQRGKILSSGIAFMYLGALMGYGLYSPPQLGSAQGNLFALQFAVVGFWIMDLVGGDRTDRIMVMSLITLFVLFVNYRGRSPRSPI